MPYTKKPKSAPRRKYNRKPKSKMTFEKRVMSVVHKQAETKQKVIALFDNTPVQGCGLISGVAVPQGLQVISIPSSMAVAQGTDQEQRLGNQINNCKLRCRGLIETLPYDATTNPNNYNYEVHMVIFKHKNDNQNNTQYFKQLPSGAIGPVDGTLINTMYPYNKDSFIIKKVKTFRMTPFISSAGLQVLAQPNTYLFKRFYLDIPVPKIWKFQDGNTTPTNDWTSIGFYVVNADGSTNINQVRCQLTMDATLTYDDF
uniref:hypothetical protein n=1 Tax=Limnohabitans sp. TaxID=1907725 RepID=UPI004047B319